MFGIIRPCRCRLPKGLAQEWLGHLCGLCLALRGQGGQVARAATNHDGLLISVLYDAQAAPAEGRSGGGWRKAGPCPLRRMRRAEVAYGDGARLAAVVSLLLASAKIRDHVADGDGALARPVLAAPARRVAGGWEAAGARGGAGLGFDTAVLIEAVERQREAEALAGPGTSVLAVTEATELATAAAFAHTAKLAGRPGNAEALAEAGRLFGRVAHLLDAVQDTEEDRRTGAWNPIAATATEPARVRQLCDDATRGVALALADAEFTDDRLVRALLVGELERAVRRTFAHAGGGFGPPPPEFGVPLGQDSGPAEEHRRSGWCDCGGCGDLCNCCQCCGGDDGDDGGGCCDCDCDCGCCDCNC
ncbi:DUF5685 family protein [Streptomyces sp. WMMC500]|uniref:DUF5685 family protein n=1 Tax=Streptomyces sp. WMMC500 TaxID=3015154 RepID=UPI00248AE34B|nr:DUF5685 family protein [Streptomyces sp. WMMC500]WBB58132.1 DUF5685 family protein [Streptomyces sp. WMMC500]